MKSNEKSTAALLTDFAAPHRSGYIASVICAVLEVMLSIAPYLLVAQMIIHLIPGDKDLPYYVILCLAAAGFWLLRYVFHGVSTTLSNKATFAVITEVTHDP